MISDQEVLEYLLRRTKLTVDEVKQKINKKRKSSRRVVWECIKTLADGNNYTYEQLMDTQDKLNRSLKTESNVQEFLDQTVELYSGSIKAKRHGEEGLIIVVDGVSGAYGLMMGCWLFMK